MKHGSKRTPDFLKKILKKNKKLQSTHSKKKLNKLKNLWTVLNNFLVLFVDPFDRPELFFCSYQIDFEYFYAKQIENEDKNFLNQKNLSFSSSQTKLEVISISIKPNKNKTSMSGWLIFLAFCFLIALAILKTSFYRSNFWSQSHTNHSNFQLSYSYQMIAKPSQNVIDSKSLSYFSQIEERNFTASISQRFYQIAFSSGKTGIIQKSNYTQKNAKRQASIIKEMKVTAQSQVRTQHPTLANFDSNLTPHFQLSTAWAIDIILNYKYENLESSMIKKHEELKIYLDQNNKDEVEAYNKVGEFLNSHKSIDRDFLKNPCNKKNFDEFIKKTKEIEQNSLKISVENRDKYVNQQFGLLLNNESKNFEFINLGKCGTTIDWKFVRQYNDLLNKTGDKSFQRLRLIIHHIFPWRFGNILKNKTNELSWEIPLVVLKCWNNTSVQFECINHFCEEKMAFEFGERTSDQQASYNFGQNVITELAVKAQILEDWIDEKPLQDKKIFEHQFSILSQKFFKQEVMFHALETHSHREIKLSETEIQKIDQGLFSKNTKQYYLDKIKRNNQQLLELKSLLLELRTKQFAKAILNYHSISLLPK